MTEDVHPKAAQLQEELLRAQKELSILYNISNAMRTTLELNHILYIILTGVTAHSGLGFNRAFLFLINKSDRCLEGKMVIGPESGEEANKIWTHIKAEEEDLEDLIGKERIANQLIHSNLFKKITKLRIPLNEKDALLITALKQGTPKHLKKENLEDYPHDPLLSLFPSDELVIMPLKAKDEIKGLIVADNIFTQRIITQNDLQIFEMLANQAGLAIENSQLYEKIVYRSHTDALTNLWNHGYFQQKLSEEIGKVKNTQRPLSLLAIDIDDFKKLNDTNGHQQGDLILQELARILKTFSREADHVCRYGGEEFAIILPETEQLQAYTIAERLREEVAKFSFPSIKKDGFLRITISIGLASYPQNATTKEDLMNQADKAMYIAKFSGKNKTSVADAEPNEE